MLIQYSNLVLRFLLELFALVAFGYWGFKIGRGMIVKIGIGIGAPLLAALVWGMFGSPGAPMPVSGLLHLILELTIFGLATAALYTSGHPAMAAIFGLTVVINRLLMYVWGQ
ncbi:YrdB family protein [Effusibacillus lacus]|nr:YrdB family protein [Effusibacillus lacus]TCS75135.1 uncharacterized protein DUF2568 [Effusibacillus lacus]